MFADDVAGFAETVVKLQQQIIDHFCRDTDIGFNIDKTFSE